MRLNYRPFIFFILFFIILSYNAFAEESDIGVLPADPDQIAMPQDNTYTSSGMDKIVSFWELPIWVQVAYLSIIAVVILGLLKLIPFMLGRLKHALENPKTREIFYDIVSNPGLTIKQLSEKQQINRGTLKYHLSQLFTNNKITLIRRGRVSQLYHKTLSPMDKESIIASYLRRDDKSPDILFTIMDNPGITNKNLSEQFRLDKSTVTDYLKKFLDDGIVEFRQDGKFKRCYLRQDARMIMLRYRP